MPRTPVSPTLLASFAFSSHKSFPKYNTMPPLLTHRSRKRARFDPESDSDRGDFSDSEVSIPSQKRVRFSDQTNVLSAGGSIQELQITVHGSDLFFSDLDKKSLWWTKGERASISEYTRKLARGFKKQESDRIVHYLHVFDECSKAPSHSTSNYIEKATLGVPVQVRGLECGFVPSIKAYRKQHSQEVLSTQEHLLKGKLSRAVCTKILAARALRSSRPSRVMARLMGEADAANEVPEVPRPKVGESK